MRILYLEPFNAGSHAAFTRTLTRGVEAEWTVLTLPGRHWKWRMRGSAVHFATDHSAALEVPHDLLVASSFVPLAELRGLVPALAPVPAVLYFHENQLAYPAQPSEDRERDLHFGFTQLVSALAAERCAFNTRYNLESFLDAGRDLLERMPDAVPSRWLDRIAERSIAIGFPLAPGGTDADLEDVPPGPAREAGPVILWNHRWEHDKDPRAFFLALERLVDRNVPFRVAVCGERYRAAPPVFETARQRLGSRVIHWGYAASRGDYETLLARSQIAVSTAVHEFFGVSMLEATHFGARPFVPDRLAYPELFPVEYRYRDEAELVAELERCCRQWVAGKLNLRGDRRHITAPHLASARLPQFGRLFAELARR